jgi:drug/metabolite transporter (DMT)-like permease
MTATGLRGRVIPGLLFGGLTAAVSGVSVFVNSYAVHSASSPAVYTTAKNFFAAVVLLGLAVTARTSRPAHRQHQAGNPGTALSGARRLAALGYVAIVGGGIAFVMFFDGLARTSAVPAAFLHDTLVIWVAFIAWPTLGERLSKWNALAIALLVVGLVATSGGVGSLTVNFGNALVLGATVLWGLETVVIKRVASFFDPARLAVVRMGGGLIVLITYLGITGQLGALIGIDADALRWVAITGVLLGVYVASWMVALTRARAVDVTSILVSSALVTAALQAVVQHKDLGSQAWGLALITAGAAAVAVSTRRRTAYR